MPEMPARPWSVWLVRSEYGTQIEEFFGGIVPEPYARPVYGIYATYEEALQYSPSQVDVLGVVRVAPLHEKPIAWTIVAPADCCPRYISVSRGGPVRNPGEDDVLAVYQSKAEAEANIANI